MGLPLATFTVSFRYPKSMKKIKVHPQSWKLTGWACSLSAQLTVPPRTVLLRQTQQPSKLLEGYILVGKQDTCWLKWSKRRLPGAESSPAKRALTLLCLDQSHRTASSLFFTSCIDSAAIASKCSAHILQPKKLRMYPLIVGRTSGIPEETEN